MAYAGRGSGVEAARAAGYTGAPSTIRKTAWSLLQDPRVVEAIEGRGVRIERGRVEPVPRVLARVDFERIAILMTIARDESAAAADRIRAIRAAARLAGDLDPRRAPLPR